MKKLTVDTVTEEDVSRLLREWRRAEDRYSASGLKSDGQAAKRAGNRYHEAESLLREHERRLAKARAERAADAEADAPVQAETVGDPDCAQCHGSGCYQCNDDIYYAQEDVAEQWRRDRAYDVGGRP